MRLLLLTILVAFATASRVSYDGFKVYEIKPTTAIQNSFLKSLERNRNFDFWSPINKVGKPVSVMVPPQVQTDLETNLTRRNIAYSVLIQNVEKIVEAERKYHKSKSLKSGRIAFDQYLRHEEINNYLAQLEEDYPDLVTVETIGQSYEGRDMNVIRISSGVDNPAVFIDAGIHAREWIAPAVALYVINQLVENPDNANLIENLDWIVLPSLNPDGYEYTWDSERFWRKTRSSGLICDGTDANRNFDWHWREAGADFWDCSEVYAGPDAFSEIETRNLRDYLTSTAVERYLSFHSYGQYVLYPWSYADVLPDNADELQALGDQIAAAINAVNGTVYTVGSTTATLYAAAGSSHDWVLGAAGVDLAYTIELPGGGLQGFDLPPEEIERVVRETFEGVKVFGVGNAKK